MNGQLDTGTVYHGSLPVRIQALDEAPSATELLLANEGNELLLKSVAALEEKAEHDENDPVSQELRRQDMKLNLLLDMLGSLLRQYQLVPPTQEVELTAESIIVHEALSLSPGQVCLVALHVDNHVPRALQLYASVQEGDPARPGVALRFFGVGHNVQNLLDKFIFRQHRRRVALNRKVQGSADD